MATLHSPTSGTFTLQSRFDATEGDIYITGIQGLIRVLLDQVRADARAGLRTAGYVTGYPGSPLGGLDIEFGRQRSFLEALQIRHVAGLNEDLAATALYGTQMAGERPDATVDGVFGMWYGKAPGVDRSGDAFRHANFRGTSRHGGVLAVAGDDPDAKSSMIPSDSTRAFEDWCMPTLFPGDVQDIVDLGLHGYALSRSSNLWCGFKIVTNVADSSGSASVGLDRIRPEIPVIEFAGRPYAPKMIGPNTGARRMIPFEEELVHARLELARQYGRLNRLNPVTVNPSGARIGIIAPGRAYFDLRQSLSDMGLDDETLRGQGVRLMKIGMLHPTDERDFRDFAVGLEEILVVEDKRAFIENAVKQALYGMTGAPAVHGKYDEERKPLLPAHGELNADIITRAIGPRLAARIDRESIGARIGALSKPQRSLLPLAVDRTAFFCSGCPHNRSLVVPDGSVVGAGIGCHIMAAGIGREEYGEVVGYAQMGSEGAQWVGMEPYVGTGHIFQNLGDGTFHHSGSLAIRFAVAAGSNVTYKLLYNDAVGMTGGQQVAGAIPIPELTEMLKAEGVKRIIVTTDDVSKYKHVKLSSIAAVRHRDDLLSAQEELAAIPGVTVLIHDQQCAAERRRLRKRGDVATPTTRLFVNERVCEMCGDCGSKSNCLSVQTVETEFGEKTSIHQSSCNLDYSCALGDCPSFVSVDISKATKPKRQTAVTLPSRPAEPSVTATDAVTIQMVGIGGTGVVTVSQILATAASLDGKFVRDLDLTGSSQKAGPVVSQLQVSSTKHEAAAYFSQGGADTYLVFDVLAGVNATNLNRASKDRTVAVVSTSAVPTGQMSAHSDLAFPSIEELKSRLESRTKADRNVYLDAQDVAQRLFGDHLLGNMVLVGAAYQAGTLGISAASIERAIDLNGVAVERNHSAFRWGRWTVADPAKVQAALEGVGGPSAAPDLRPIDPRVAALGLSEALSRSLSIRVEDLVGYADVRYSDQYLDDVRAVVEQLRRAGVTDEAPVDAVVRQLHRVMAYKDEYEVARLLTADELRAQITDQFGEGATIAYQLHPPMLRAMGMSRKISISGRLDGALRMLAKSKRLRHTRMDPFGYAKVRRVERALIEHYRALVRDSITLTTPDNAHAVAELLGLIAVVRGYENIKLANVVRYRGEVRAAADKLGVPVRLSRLLEGVTPDAHEAGGQ